MKKCEKCGMMGGDDMAFCVNCGGNMVEVSAEPVEMKPVDGAFGSMVSATPVKTTTNTIGMDKTEAKAKPRMKMNKNTVLLIGIIAAVLVGIGGIVFGIVMANTKNTGSGQKSSSPATITVTTTEVTAGKWVFTIPDGLEYSVDDDNALTFGEEGDWMAITRYEGTATYSKVKNNLQTYAKELAKQLSMEVYKTGTTEVGDGEFTWIDFIVRSDTGDKGYCTVIFSEASDMYTFVTFYANSQYELSHDRFEEIAEVVGSAKRKTGSKVIINNEIEIDILKLIDLSVVGL